MTYTRPTIGGEKKAFLEAKGYWCEGLTTDRMPRGPGSYCLSTPVGAATIVTGQGIGIAISLSLTHASYAVRLCWPFKAVFLRSESLVTAAQGWASHVFTGRAPSCVTVCLSVLAVFLFCLIPLLITTEGQGRHSFDGRPLGRRPFVRYRLGTLPVPRR